MEKLLLLENHIDVLLTKNSSDETKNEQLVGRIKILEEHNDVLLLESKLLKIKNEQLEAQAVNLEKYIDILLTENPSDHVKEESSNGDGPIRSKEGNKCYHGCTAEEASWDKNASKYNHVFWVYNDDYHWKSYHHPNKWDIRRNDLTSFCNNFELDYELSKRKRTHKTYRCLGHDIKV